jgi:hypothetical protein
MPVISCVDCERCDALQERSVVLYVACKASEGWICPLLKERSRTSLGNLNSVTFVARRSRLQILKPKDIEHRLKSELNLVLV